MPDTQRSQETERSQDRVRSETELIQTYLAPLAKSPGALGLRDDAAYFTPPPGTDLVVTTDPIVSGVHFLADERADDIAWKALAVNVSDLASKGAVPLAYTMALGFPKAPTHDFMRLFARGLEDAQTRFGCTLLGGDTDCREGPFSVSITIFGAVPTRTMVERRGARAGDALFVTGTLGDAALGLALHGGAPAHEEALTDGDRGFLMARYLRPEPRVELAPLLRLYASAALDISDGFAKDATRLLAASGTSAIVSFSDLPLSPSAERLIAAEPSLAAAVVSGGDDYEVLFCVPANRVGELRHDLAHLPFKVTHIATLTEGGESPSLTITTEIGSAMELDQTGWDHFSRG